MTQSDQPRETIATTALRSLTKTLFGVLGVVLGVFLVAVLFGGFFVGTGMNAILPPQPKYDVEIRADAQGKRAPLAHSAPILLVLDIHGMIGSRHVNAQNFTEQLQETTEGVFKGRNIAGILLHINSPGGAHPDVDGMYRAVRDYAQKRRIPIYAYAESMALSGGYYMAVAAEKIFASPSALIGSIGVVLPPMINFSGAMDKFGLQSVTVSAGEDKDLMNPTRPWRPNEQLPLKEMADFYYEQFVELVALNRDIDKQDIIEDVKARFYPSQKALELGLIDNANATFDQVIQELAERVEIADQGYQVVGLKRRVNVFDDLFHEKGFFSGNMTHTVVVPGVSSDSLATVVQ